MKRSLPILSVVAMIVAVWYVAAVWMNAAWVYDQAARAETEVTASQVLVATLDQERPVLPTPHQVIELMLPYIERQMAQGARFWHIARHMLGLFQGVPGARLWRRHLSEIGHLPTSGPQVMLDALKKVPQL